MIEINIDPVAFWNVRWYGILIAFGILLLVAWIAWNVKRDKRMSVDTVMVASIVAIPTGVIFSRLVHVIDLWDYYSQHLDQLIGGEGLTIWGAIIGGTIGIFITSRITKFNFGYFTDILAPGLIVAQILGRIGCVINGCCYGDECTLPWGIIYTHPDAFGPSTAAVHPTQVYEIIFLLISLLIIILLRKRIKPEGSLYFAYLGLYSAWRIGIGFMRDGTDFAFGLHEAQIIGIILLAIIIPVMIKKTRWGKPDPDEPDITGLRIEAVPVAVSTGFSDETDEPEAEAEEKEEIEKPRLEDLIHTERDDEKKN